MAGRDVPVGLLDVGVMLFALGHAVSWPVTATICTGPSRP